MITEHDTLDRNISALPHACLRPTATAQSWNDVHDGGAVAGSTVFAVLRHRLRFDTNAPGVIGEISQVGYKGITLTWAALRHGCTCRLSVFVCLFDSSSVPCREIEEVEEKSSQSSTRAAGPARSASKHVLSRPEASSTFCAEQDRPSRSVISMFCCYHQNPSCTAILYAAPPPVASTYGPCLALLACCLWLTQPPVPVPAVKYAALA
jgi:hypothetical protein